MPDINDPTYTQIITCITARHVNSQLTVDRDKQLEAKNATCVTCVVRAPSTTR